MTATEKMLPDKDWPADQLVRAEHCPICRASERVLLYEGLRDRTFFCAPGVWTLYRCEQCGAAYQDPQPAPEAIGLAYATYYTHGTPVNIDRETADLRGRRRLKRMLINGYLNWRYGYSLHPASWYGRYLPHLSPVVSSLADKEVRWLSRPAENGKLLDLGCGNGQFLLRIKALGWQAYGLDMDSAAVASARSVGLEVQEGDLETSTYPDAYFDVITMSHVIEHIYDPVATLRSCARALKPGGLLWIATPNLASQVHERYGANWRGLETPRHLVLFTPGALQRACVLAGLEVSRVGATAQTYIGESRAIERRTDPCAWYPQTKEDLELVRRAQRHAAANPARAEELVVVAQRPLSSTAV